jgi:hypothetical protein
MDSVRLLIVAVLFTIVGCQNKDNLIIVDTKGILNNNADQVGTWINSTCDEYNQEYVDVLKKLNTKSIRHGWQYSVMDEKECNIFHMVPCDIDVQNYIGDGHCKVEETIVVDEIARLTADLNVPGFAIIGMDGIHYTGTEDNMLMAMSKIEREQYYIDNAVRWAKWGKENNFKYFELGNENDLPGEMVKKNVGTPWISHEYGAYALRMAKAIKEVYPQSKCGINGGFGETPELRYHWWNGIVEGAPEINKYIDFVVVHTYTFEVDYTLWKEKTWAFGKCIPDNIENIQKFFPNKPVYVTEISGFKTEEGIVPHYRGVLNCEMMGNAFSDSIVEHIHHWPTRWEDFGALDQNSTTLNALGKGLYAYTKFAKPVMTSNGVLGNVRYFMAKDPKDNSLALWLINRAAASITLNVQIDNFACSPINEHWKLISPDDNPLSTQNELVKQGAIEIKLKNSKAKFSVNINATSVSVISFK